jgi:hypothetical protein
VVVAKPFGLGRYEVTVAQWKTCMAEGGCPNLPSMKSYPDATPVYNVTHDDALAYAAWLARTTGQPYRLPARPSGSTQPGQERPHPTGGTIRPTPGTCCAASAAVRWTVRRRLRSTASPPIPGG